MYFLYCGEGAWGCTASDELWNAWCDIPETDTWPTIHDSISLWMFDGRGGMSQWRRARKLRAISYCCQGDQTSAESSDMNYTSRQMENRRALSTAALRTLKNHNGQLFLGDRDSGHFQKQLGATRWRTPNPRH